MAEFRLSDEETSGRLADCIRLETKVGQGSFGAVYRARHFRTNAILAVKQVAIEPGTLEVIMEEIRFMDKCRSSQIVALVGYFHEHEMLSIVMEYCEGGSVADLIREHGRLTEPQMVSILADSLAGLAFIHRLNHIHRDIKAGNILITADGDCKLADFGVAGQLKDASSKRRTVIGTPYWMAPEVIEETGYTTRADMWSLGITCIEMADGKPPLHEIHPMRAIFMIPSNPPPRLSNEKRYSMEFVDIVTACLIKDPEQRPDAAMILTKSSLIRNADPVNIRVLVHAQAQARQRPRRPSGNSGSDAGAGGGGVAGPALQRRPSANQSVLSQAQFSPASPSHLSSSAPMLAPSPRGAIPMRRRPSDVQLSVLNAVVEGAANGGRNVIEFERRGDSLRHRRKNSASSANDADGTSPG